MKKVITILLLLSCLCSQAQMNKVMIGVEANDPIIFHNALDFQLSGQYFFADVLAFEVVAGYGSYQNEGSGFVISNKVKGYNLGGGVSFYSAPKRNNQFVFGTQVMATNWKKSWVLGIRDWMNEEFEKNINALIVNLKFGYQIRIYKHLHVTPYLKYNIYSLGTITGSGSRKRYNISYNPGVGSINKYNAGFSLALQWRFGERFATRIKK